MKLSMVLSLQDTSFGAVFKAELDPLLKELRELGFDGVELALADPLEVDQREVFRIVSEHGLEVPAVGTGQAYLRDGLSLLSSDEGVRKKAVERIKNHVDFAQLFGAQVIIGLIRGGKSVGKEFIDSMRECADHALKKGIILTIEPINRYEVDFINNVEEAIDFIRSLGAKNVHLLLDTFHMNIEEPSIEKSIERSKPYLSHVHLADSNREAPGYGHLDFGSIIKTLKKIGYRRYLSAEILPIPDQHKAAQQTINLLRSLM